MKLTLLTIATAPFLAAMLPAGAEELKLPKEVTPQMRAACESDVRRLCVDDDPTVAKVKSCVMRKFLQLGMRCQIVLASAGLKP
ncbi:MAG: hypothetical protein NW205_06100 [Hyphomicrobiaceae bacterium]|nr:hypothetical protein [Hyphomicrobiaceae bacterium]